MERPDSVSRVAPPTSTIRKTRPATAMSQKRMARRTSKPLVWEKADAVWDMAMENFEACVRNCLGGSNPDFCLKHAEGATRTKHVAWRRDELAKWCGGDVERPM